MFKLKALLCPFPQSNFETGWWFSSQGQSLHRLAGRAQAIEERLGGARKVVVFAEEWLVVAVGRVGHE